ncbi:MAG: DUF1631 family protein, partial [Rubrivivax sp.]
MNQTPALGLPTPIADAVRRLKSAARGAAERAVDSLGVSALSSGNTAQREHLLGAQFELSRKLAQFCITFDQSLDARVEREVLQRASTHGAPVETSWDSLSLVDNDEMEARVSAERFGIQIGVECEGEQRELDGFAGSLLLGGSGDAPRNPLRPEVIGIAMIHGVDKVTDRADLRKVLLVELARTLATSMPQTYAQIVADMRSAGVKPASLAIKPSDTGRTGFGRSASGYFDTSSRSAGLDTAAPQMLGSTPPAQTGNGRLASASSPGGAHGAGQRSSTQGSGQGTPIGQIDAGLMTLIRRLAELGPSTEDSNFAPEGALHHSSAGALDGAEQRRTPVAPNLIHKHRAALQHASNGSLDHMVIDVIGSLFDQILSDPKVPPQMARQIARLQLPVLRAALGDPSFFSSRKHPVRRFVNRIASLGSGFDDFESDAGRRFVGLVQDLVQEIVAGDFDQIEAYDQRLTILETFIVDQARHEVQEQSGAATLLAERETELRLQQRYAQQLQILLAPLPIADFLRDFISQVWSQALMRAAHLDGTNGERVQRMRFAGRELIMSVQPKGSPAARKAFLMQLPALMKELNSGMDLVGWPEPAKKAFFGQLLPSHAESLKHPPLSTLDHNLLIKQADAALGEPLPVAGELPPPRANIPVLRDEVILPNFTAEERHRIGLMDESTVDWDGKVDIDLGAEPEAGEGDLDLPGLPKAETPEPSRGKSLADHVQIGFAYQMHRDGKWQKV